MDDLISREKLKRKFCGHCVDYGKCEKECFDLQIINSMPTAEPRTGKWVLMSDCTGKYYACSWCGREGYSGMNYCPNCGAKMED